MGWYCGDGVSELIGCLSLSPSLALPFSFNILIMTELPTTAGSGSISYGIMLWPGTTLVHKFRVLCSQSTWNLLTSQCLTTKSSESGVLLN